MLLYTEKSLFVVLWFKHECELSLKDPESCHDNNILVIGNHYYSFPQWTLHVSLKFWSMFASNYNNWQIIKKQKNPTNKHFYDNSWWQKYFLSHCNVMGYCYWIVLWLTYYDESCMTWNLRFDLIFL